MDIRVGDVVVRGLEVIVLQVLTVLTRVRQSPCVRQSGGQVCFRLAVSALVVRSPSMILPVSVPLVNDTVTPVFMFRIL